MFRTPIAVPQSPHKINMDTPVLSIGSCFAGCIGERLLRYKFPALANPFGTVFNPHSVYKSLLYAIANRPPDPDGYLCHQGMYFHYDFHSRFRSPDQPTLARQLTDALAQARRFLAGCRWLLVTFGTAVVHERAQHGAIVANCHKAPASHFKKRLLTVAEVTEGFGQLSDSLAQHNPRLRYVLTVSPVRHLKEGLAQNQLSKSLLRVACAEIAQTHGHAQYFPAYEALVDDLRDYRFYQPDMAHPTPQAEEYIWEAFKTAYLSEQALVFCDRWQKIRDALNHKPFNPGAEPHQRFVRATIRELESLAGTVNVAEELSKMGKMLSKTQSGDPTP